MSATHKAMAWLDQIGQNFAILTKPSALSEAQGSVDALTAVIRQDPVFCLEIFRHACKVSQNNDTFISLKDAISAIGITALLDWSATLPRMDPSASSSRSFMTNIGDGFVSVGLLERWHRTRNIEWQEADHWACLFSYAARWLVAYKDPMLVEGIDFRIGQGESIERVYEAVFEFGYQECNEAIAERFHIPTVGLLDVSAKLKANKSAAFKYQALNYYLPISTSLASACRSEWGTLRFQKLVGRATAATLIDGFNRQLPMWLAQIAREYSLPSCAAAILAAFQYQGDIIQITVDGVGQAPKPSANSATTQPQVRQESPIPPTSASPDKPIPVQPPAGGLVSPAEDNPFGAFAPATTPDRGDAETVQRFMQLLIEQKDRFTSDDVVFTRLVKVLIEGMGCSRALVSLYQQRIGQIRVQYRHHKSDQKSMGHLSFSLPDSGIIAYLATKSESFWMTPSRAEDTWDQLPNKMRQVVKCDDFFIHSIHVHGKFRALVYVDAFEQTTLLREPEYRQFRALITQVESLLNIL